MGEVIAFPTDSMMEPDDAAARVEALDIRRSFIVEAPAGSGKTGLLIQRYMKLLTDESVTEPEQVLAITFTNKAAAELRDRVLKQLELATDAGAPVARNDFDRTSRELALAVLARDRQLGWALLEQPHRLYLRTIDSMCAEIARTLPILSGSGGRLAPVEDGGTLHREAARRTLLTLGSGGAALDRALRDLLLHRDGNLAECESLIANMLSLRDQWARLFPLTGEQLEDAYLDAEVLPRLEGALDQVICSGLTHLANVFPPEWLDELTALAAEFGLREGYKGGESPLKICASLRASPQAASAELDQWRALAHLLLTKQNDWRKTGGLNRKNLGFEYDTKHTSHARLAGILEFLSGHPELLEALCRLRELPPARYPTEQWLIAKSLFRILSRALVELKLVFAERGECDFTEISLLARQALEQECGAEDLASALGARLQHLLVDEMQDTSTSQYELLESLTSTWDGFSQTLFLVGDPHQSIYLFRQARVERFLEVLRTKILGDVPVTRLRLSANFRSQRTLVDDFNRDFKLILPASAHSDGYKPVAATLPASPAGLATSWHINIIGNAGVSATTAPTTAEMRSFQAKADADEIVRIVRGWMEKPLPQGRTKPWTMSVLVRSRRHLNELVEALRRQHEPLPFKAVEIESLGERQEILDLTALARALLHPADRVAAFAVLRAPWCGLPLADLYTLAAGDDPAFRHYSVLRLMSERGHLLSDDSCRRMARVWNILEAARKLRASVPAAQLVERAWLSLGGDLWLTPLQRRNAARFFELLDELGAAGGRIDSAGLEAKLQKLYSEPEVISPDVPSLELLTIHKAKGLEWDVVILPALERKTSSQHSRLLNWAEIDSPARDATAHIMLAPIQGKGEESHELNQWLSSIRRTRELAEVKRLFYVAATRAREELHLFAAPELKVDGTPRLIAESLLAAAWPAAELRIDGAMRAEVKDPFSVGGESPASGLFDLAASAGSNRPTLQRVPSNFNPTARFNDPGFATPLISSSDTDAASHAQFTRPQGSVAARAFGNVVHECLDLVSRKLSGGETVSAVLRQLPEWNKRIAALLRSHGLSRPAVERLTRKTESALDGVLRDSAGTWLLSPRHQARSEYAITSLSGTIEPGRTQGDAATVRMDRVFLAGPQSQIEGEDFLWIVDYKTTEPLDTTLDGFLDEQRATYGPQLQAYAHVLGPAHAKLPAQIRLALYFPMIPHLLWWQCSADE